MDEPERGLKAEDRRLGESRCRVCGDVTVEVRERRYDAELRILAEHCRCPRQRSGFARQARQPQLDGPRDGGRPDLHHRPRLVGPRGHLLARERVEQRAQQQRVAARRLEARPRERLVGVGGEHARTSASTAAWLSAFGSTSRAAGSATSSESSTFSNPCSGGRSAATTSTGRPSSLRTR